MKWLRWLKGADPAWDDTPATREIERQLLELRNCNCDKMTGHWRECPAWRSNKTVGLHDDDG